MNELWGYGFNGWAFKLGLKKMKGKEDGRGRKITRIIITIWTIIINNNYILITI